MAAVNAQGAPQFGKGARVLTVLVPITESPGDWLREYVALARRDGLPAEALHEPDGMRLRVAVAPGSSREEVFATLDAALQLVDEAKVEAQRKAASNAATRQHIMDWWAQRSTTDSAN